MRTAKTDQTGRMPRLIGVFTGRTAILLVFSCRGSYQFVRGVFIYTKPMVEMASEFELDYTYISQMSHLMRLWHFSSSVNSFFKRACAAIHGARCLIFGRTLCLLPYFKCANSEGSGESAHMRRLA